MTDRGGVALGAVQEGKRDPGEVVSGAYQSQIAGCAWEPVPKEMSV